MWAWLYFQYLSGYTAMQSCRGSCPCPCPYPCPCPCPCPCLWALAATRVTAAGRSRSTAGFRPTCQQGWSTQQSTCWPPTTCNLAGHIDCLCATLAGPNALHRRSCFCQPFAWLSTDSKLRQSVVAGLGKAAPVECPSCLLHAKCCRIEAG